MSIFKRLYGKRIPATKMDAENPVGEEARPAPTTTTTATETAATTEPITTTETTEPTKTVETSPTTEPTPQTTTTETTTPPSNGDVPTSNGAPRSFQFGAKAKMFRDMLAQHGRKIQATECDDQTKLLGFICILGVAVLCSFAAVGTSHWQCDAGQCYGLWNTCQKDTTFAPPEANSTETNASKIIETAIACVHHNAQNRLELIVADQTRIDQVQASQGLIISGLVACLVSLVLVVLAHRFFKNKPAQGLNTVRNLLVAAIFTHVIAYLLLLVGFFLYILTERFSTSIGILFVYFGLALFANNVINFITVEYKTYKMRQQQVQIN